MLHVTVSMLMPKKKSYIESLFSITFWIHVPSAFVKLLDISEEVVCVHWAEGTVFSFSRYLQVNYIHDSVRSIVMVPEYELSNFVNNQ
jgi:hypothetical protein